MNLSPRQHGTSTGTLSTSAFGNYSSGTHVQQHSYKETRAHESGNASPHSTTVTWCNGGLLNANNKQKSSALIAKTPAAETWSSVQNGSLRSKNNNRTLESVDALKTESTNATSSLTNCSPWTATTSGKNDDAKASSSIFTSTATSPAEVLILKGKRQTKTNDRLEQQNFEDRIRRENGSSVSAALKVSLPGDELFDVSAASSSNCKLGAKLPTVDKTGVEEVKQSKIVPPPDYNSLCSPQSDRSADQESNSGSSGFLEKLGPSASPIKITKELLERQQELLLRQQQAKAASKIAGKLAGIPRLV